MLASIDRADDALRLADMAEAARVWALKSKQSVPVVNYATSIKARALKRMAECVDLGQARGEIAKKQDTLRRGPDIPSGNNGAATLADLDILPKRLHEARKLAALSEVEIAVVIAEQNEQDHVIGIGELVHLAQRKKRTAKEEAREERRANNRTELAQAQDINELCGHRFATLVFDPPWDWGDEGDVDQLGRARPTYATMPLAEVAGLPISDLADQDAHLYLWITNRSLPKGFALLDGWGFRYLTCLTWCKPSIGMGQYYRGSTEQVLFGVRGSQSLLRKDVGTWFAAPRPGEHSAKPPEFFSLVESCSPGPYLELFARAPRPGWTVWGAEA